MGNGPPYRDYANEGSGYITKPVPLGKPRDGHGTVYVRQFRDGTWSASWQDTFPAPRHDGVVAGVDDHEGDEESVLSWARSRPAERFLIFSPAAGDYVPLDTHET